MTISALSRSAKNGSLELVFLTRKQLISQLQVLKFDFEENGHYFEIQIPSGIAMLTAIL